jgi:hypothetical protein
MFVLLMVLTISTAVGVDNARAHDLAIGQVLRNDLAVYGGGLSAIRTADKFVFSVVQLVNGVLTCDAKFHLDFQLK